MHRLRFFARCFHPASATISISSDKRTFSAAAATAAASAAFAAAGLAASMGGVHHSNIVEASSQPADYSDIFHPAKEKPSRPSSAAALGRYTVADAVERILPSVVQLRVSVVGERRLRSMFTGSPSPVEIGVSFGSGFVISNDEADGTSKILTNAHVVRDGDRPTSSISNTSTRDAERVDIQIMAGADGERSWDGTVLAYDESSDLAIVSVDTLLPAAVIADSSRVRAGEFVVAVGAPLTLTESCSFGIISCLQRDLEKTTGENTSGLTYFQTDLAINQGSSGAPLCDLDGNVVGVCAKKIEGGGSEGVGFCIPSNYAMAIVKELENYGSVRRPYLGLAVIALTKTVVEDIRADPNYEIPRWLGEEEDALSPSKRKATGSAVSKGLIVHDVTKNGPAYKAGIRRGDVIIQVDGTRTSTASQFLHEMSFKVGEEVRVKYRAFDSGDTRTVVVTPESLMDENDPPSSSNKSR